MRPVGTVVAVILALLWSALVWGGYALIVMSTAFVAQSTNNVGLPADVAGWAGVLDGLLQQYGTAAAAVVWALGLLLILALRALFNALTGAGRTRGVEAPRQPLPPVAPRTAAVRPPPAPPVAAQPPVAPPPAASPAPRWGRDAAR